jgi:hypothetical protein
MSQLLQTIQNQAEDSEFDELDSVMDEVDSRPEDLYWKEEDDGSLLVGDDNVSPSIIARVSLGEDGLTAQVVESSEITWTSPFISSPGTGIQDRQFD